MNHSSARRSATPAPGWGVLVLALCAQALPVTVRAAEGQPVRVHAEAVAGKARQAKIEERAAEQATNSAQSGTGVIAPNAPMPADTFYGPPAPKARKGEIGNIGWTEPNDFVPPALEEAVNIVTEKYPTVLSGRAALKAAASDVNAAKWLRFPTLNGNLQYQHSPGQSSRRCKFGTIC
jgi:Outer membrane efflux protein